MQDAAITVVVMAYNEAATLEPVVREINGVLDRIPPSGHEILIVDDGSDDGSGAIADGLARALPRVRVVRHRENTGLGGVYRTGFSEARGDLLTFFPADGQFPATIIEQYLPLIRTADLVLGFLDRPRRWGVGPLLSAVERLGYRLLVGTLPRFQGIMMVRRELLDSLPLISTGRGVGVVMELIMRAARGAYRIQSAAIPLRPRVSGASKVANTRTVVSNIKQLLALRRALRPPAVNTRA